MEWLLIKTVFSLLAVLGLMVGLVYLLKKFTQQGGARGSSAVPIDILGQRSLGPKRSVVVLQVAGKVMVVGVTEHGMHPLSEITGKTALAKINARRASTQPAVSFAEQLQGMFQGKLKKSPARKAALGVAE